MQKIRNWKTQTKIYFIIIGIVVLLNVIAWSSETFCDWYIRYVFPVWVNTSGRLTGLFPFSVGEWLIVAGGYTDDCVCTQVDNKAMQGAPCG